MPAWCVLQAITVSVKGTVLCLYRLLGSDRHTIDMIAVSSTLLLEIQTLQLVKPV